MQQTTQTPSPVQPVSSASPAASTPPPPKKNNTLKWVLIILAIIIVLGLIAGAGCWFVGRRAVKTLQKEAAKVTEQIPEGLAPKEITYKKETKEVSISEKFPKDFPLYTDAKVVTSGSYGDTVSVVLSTPDSAFSVFKWYKNEIPKAGYEVSSELDTIESKNIIVEGKGYAGSIIITEEEKEVLITVSLYKSNN